MKHKNKKLFHKCFSEDAVRQKWRGLRDTFRKEIAKLDQKRNGDSGDDEPQSKWHYFKQLLFIKDQFTPRTTTGNIDRGVQQYSTCDETIEDATLSPMSNNDQSQLGTEPDMNQQGQTSINASSFSDDTVRDQQRETYINPSFSNDKKRPATNQAQSNKINPPQKKQKLLKMTQFNNLCILKKKNCSNLSSIWSIIISRTMTHTSY